MDYLTLKSLQEAMKFMGIEWIAGETEVSASLSEEPSMSLFGLAIGEKERLSLLKRATEIEALTFLAAAPPPPEINWRDYLGDNWVTPVKNQRTCGSCVAFATCATLESRYRIMRQEPNLDIDLSEAHLFFCGCGKCCQTGWNFIPALKFCLDKGVGREADFPYTPVDQSCKEIQPVVKVTGYGIQRNTLPRKQAIANGGPVLAGMRVYEDLYYYKGGVYRHVAGRFRGNHAIAVVGYNDYEDYWIVKNSWGLNWGEGGYLIIAYGECGLDSAFPFFNPSVKDA